MKFIDKHTCLTLLIVSLFMFISTAEAGVIYSNYGPGFNYDMTHANVIGPIIPGQTPLYIAIAEPFTPAQTVALGAIYVSLGCWICAGPIPVDVSVNLDSGGLPGQEIESIQALLPFVALTHVVTLNSADHPVLSAEQQYWVVVSNATADTSVTWAWASGDSGVSLHEYSSGGWLVTSPQKAFQVDSVPEPGSAILVLLSIGTLGGLSRFRFFRS